MRGLALQVMGQIANGGFQAHLHLVVKSCDYKGHNFK